MAQSDTPRAKVRVEVAGRGCKGYVYRMGLDEALKEDIKFSDQGIEMLTDFTSLRILKGSVVDYVDGEEGAGFKFDNPNDGPSCAPSACGGCPMQEK